MSVREWCAEIDEEIILADGFDDAFVGVAERCGMGPVAVYDREKCIEVLISKAFGREDAEEYFDFNVAGCKFSEGNPTFIDTL